MTIHHFSTLLPNTEPLSPKPQPWYCPIHGKMEPLFIGTWKRQGCPCERNARLKQEEQARKAQEYQQGLIQTYQWMGEGTGSLQLSTLTFDNFNPSRQPQQYREAITQALSKAREFANNPVGSIVLYGTVGTGKTHLLAATCNALRQQGKIVKFASATELLRLIQSRMSTNEDWHSVMTTVKKAYFLVLDDVDKVPHSETRENFYYELVNYRVNRNLPTGITSNSLTAMSDYIGVHAMSRLQQNMMACQMLGEDIRRSKK